MTSRHALTALFHRLGVGVPARSRAFAGDGAPSVPRLLVASSGCRGLPKRLTLTCLVTVCALGGGMAVASAPALALRHHVFNFHFGTSGSGNGQIEAPTSIAVNEATGNVYVAEYGTSPRVQYFSAAGAYLGQFNGSGLLVNGKGEHFEGKPAGSGPGEVETGRFERPKAIAIDNSTSPSDPSAGDVYVLDAAPEFGFGRHEVIDKFSPTGAYIGQIVPLHSSANKPALGGVAVDPSGNVWTTERFVEGYQRSEVVSFNDAVANELSASHIPKFGIFVSSLAVDSNTDLYGSSSGPVTKYDSGGEVLKLEFGLITESLGLAVALPSNDVYSVSRESAGRYSSEGVPIESFGVGRLSSGSAIGVNSSSETVYVADEAAGVVNVFTLEAPSAPTVEGWVSDLTGDSATLHAEVNPNGASSEYHFEYVPCASGPVCTAPVPAGQLGAEFENRSFSLHLQGLLPGSAYHFRVLARNQLGSTEGKEHTFTTQTTGTSNALPDGRAWEMVSPAE